MDIIISNSSDKPIYQQIESQIKNKIINGGLEPGDALPSIRRLAKELHISVITTKRAYEELEKEGFINKVTGRGSFVAAQNSDLLRERRLKVVEEKLLEAIEAGRSIELGSEELQEMLEVLYDSFRGQEGL